MPHSLLTIAGTDPTSGAGVAADLAVFADFGLHGLWVPTAILDQDSAVVHALEPRDAGATARAVARILGAGRPAGVKLGLLGSSAIAAALADVLSPLAGSLPIVLDPVLASGAGAGLADEDLVETLRRRLLPLVTVLTPNAPEAAALAGRPVDDLSDAQEAAQALLAFGCKAVLLKGGHLSGAPGDVWATPTELAVLANRESFPHDVHGTGCHLSSALLALLARGASGQAAARGARSYLAACVAAAEVLPGEDEGRPIVIHGEATRRAARLAMDAVGCGDQ